jgi:hypothetical protein
MRLACSEVFPLWRVPLTRTTRVSNRAQPLREGLVAGRMLPFERVDYFDWRHGRSSLASGKPCDRCEYLSWEFVVAGARYSSGPTTLIACSLMNR